MHKLVKAAVLSLLLCTVSGCAMPDSPQRKPQPQQGQVKGQVQINPELTDQVKEEVRTARGVEESLALVMNDQIAVAVKVAGFDRLRLKSIKQELHGKVKSIAPEYDVHVTTDKKIFAELQELIGQIKDAPPGNLPVRVKDQFNIIIEDMNG